MKVILGILIPFIGTIIGALLVFFMKKEINKKIEIIIYGFAAGVMMAALIWSLIIPAIESSSVIPVVIGLVLGVGTFYLMDLYFNKKKKINNLMVAVTLHNIPEGMAVGVAFASYLVGGLSLAAAYALAIGIAIQNFPEGSVVSFPLLKQGFSKRKAFMYGFISAVFELLGTLVTLLFTNFVVAILPYMLSIAAGAMMYVVVVELIPESNDKSKLNVIGFLIGFIIMMLLDVMLG
ncbi:MAG: ZIP family metal transporter [Firmicutes bacterium]|nr:ZIP family metal transporter [Bacillota bacterium]